MTIRKSNNRPLDRRETGASMPTPDDALCQNIKDNRGRGGGSDTCTRAGVRAALPTHVYPTLAMIFGKEKGSLQGGGDGGGRHFQKHGRLCVTVRPFFPVYLVLITIPLYSLESDREVHTVQLSHTCRYIILR